MEIPKEIGLAIRKERLKQKLTLEGLDKKSGVPFSTISKVENGTKVKLEILLKIAEGLSISYNQLISNSQLPLRIGVGACLMAAPIIYGIGENKYSSDNLEITYYKEDEEDKPFTSKSEKERRPSQKSELFTAPKLIKDLLENKYDAIFVPSETYSFYDKEEITKVASIMNTAKGAVLLLACSFKQDNLDAYINEYIKNVSNNTHFYYLEETIADKMVTYFFLNKKNAHYAFTGKQMTDLNKFTDELATELKASCKKDNTVIFVGWQPHISIVKAKLEDLKTPSQTLFTEIFDISEFTHLEEPYQYISFDCVIKSDKKNELKSRTDFSDFFKLLKSSINKINEIKAFGGVHPSLKRISELLLMKEDKEQSADSKIKQTHQSLHKINFDLQFYPEWVL